MNKKVIEISRTWTRCPEILLHPNIPKPLHGLAPRTLMGKEWWDKNRQIAYRSTDYHCIACGVHKKDAKYHQWLEAHEEYDIDYEDGTMTFKRLVPLCHSCHNYIHSGRMEALVRKGEMEKEKMEDILEYGDDVLKNAGIKRKDNIPNKIAQWEDWVLIFEGKRYKGKFKSFNEWQEYYK